MEIPTNINKTHLLKAIEKIDLEGIPNDGDSQYYDVEYNGKRYPPKVIVSYANLYANGEVLDRRTFSGGIKTKCFKLLNENGFMIKRKETGITKEIVLAIIDLCAKMEEGKRSGTITLKTYSKIFRPFIDDFKDKFLKTPNLFLQNELKIFYESQFEGSQPKIHVQDFKFWGRSINNYIWSCIYYDLDKEVHRASYSPQLYVLINREGIKVGFCYGHYVSNNDIMVSSVLSGRNFSLLKECLEFDKELYFVNSAEGEVTARPEKLFGSDERISTNSDEGIRENWSRHSLLTKEFTKESIPENISEIIQNTLSNLSNFFISLLPTASMNESTIQKNKIEKVQFDVTSFNDSIRLSEIYVPEKLATCFIASLLTKPFVILTGLSGSGKTKLAQAFAMWLCDNESQYCIIPVGADWTNREPLLGFPNALEKEQYVKPDSKVLDMLVSAGKNVNKPYFLILDEMNLSHVERYFADFLSAMESKSKIFLHSGNEEWNGVPSKLALQRNVFIIGTVNIDETTYMFSPKVLDRASVIEFKVTSDEMKNYLQSSSIVDLESLTGLGASMASSFVEMAADEHQEMVNSVAIMDSLLKFFNELRKVGAEFGYRTASEILRFAGIVNRIEPRMSIFQIIDAAIMQKLLPKLHGSRRKLEPVLKALASLCLESGKSIEEIVSSGQEIDFANTSLIKYPVSLEKILRMYENLKNNGFTSYAEA